MKDIHGYIPVVTSGFASPLYKLRNKIGNISVSAEYKVHQASDKTLVKLNFFINKWVSSIPYFRVHMRINRSKCRNRARHLEFITDIFDPRCLVHKKMPVCLVM